MNIETPHYTFIYGQKVYITGGIRRGLFGFINYNQDLKSSSLRVTCFKWVGVRDYHKKFIWRIAESDFYGPETKKIDARQLPDTENFYISEKVYIKKNPAQRLFGFVMVNLTAIVKNDFLKVSVYDKRGISMIGRGSMRPAETELYEGKK